MPTLLYDVPTQTIVPLKPALPRQMRLHVPAGADSLARVRSLAVASVLQRQLEFRGFAVADDASALVGAEPQVSAHGFAIEGRWIATGAVEPVGAPRGPEATRYALLNAPYRALLGAELEGMLDDAERKLESLYATRKRLADLPEERIIDVQTAPAAELAELPHALGAALDADLDLPLALGAIAPFLKAVNELCDGALRKQGRVNRSAVEAAQEGFATLQGRLGLGTDEPARFLRQLRDARARARGIDAREVEAKIQARVRARVAKDFATADRLQTELTQQGIMLLDHAQGTDWTLPA